MLELSMADKIRRTQFLGREFLTWLMYRSATDEGVFREEDGSVTEIFFERALTLDGDNPAREMSSIKVDDPTNSDEVMLALRLGKKVSRARLMLLIGGREFTTVVDAAGLGMRSTKLPDALAPDPAEAMAEKAVSCSELEDTLYRLFTRFMRMRIDPEAWSTEVAGVAGWIHGLGAAQPPENDADAFEPPVPPFRPGARGGSKPGK